MIPSTVHAAFRDSLFAGNYNLLLGSGISLNSRNDQGELLRGSEQLREDLCAVSGARPTTSLSRAYSLLTPQQRQAELVGKYRNCHPGAELRPLSRYLWKRAFTFNIDDVLEVLYSQGEGIQQLISLNFDSTFEPDTSLSELHCVHLHGYVHKPGPGFVFSHSEYARVMHGNNPWMLLLSEILPSEAFVIAGASLDEVDLEYYLARRTASTPRRGRGPSLLIEPDPDAATEADCKKYDLTLVKAEFGEFLAWLAGTLPEPPSPTALVVPQGESIFRTKVPAPTELRFFSDFELVRGEHIASSTAGGGSGPSPYMYGAEPTWQDIASHVDIERRANEAAMDWATDWLEEPREGDRLLLCSDEAATGKTTLLKRIGYDLAALGHVVLNVRTLSRMDVETAKQCLERLVSPAVILVDNFADHAEQVLDLLDVTRARHNVAIVGAERKYRQEHIDVVFADTPVAVKRLSAPTKAELRQLLEKYRRLGLVGDERLVQSRGGAIGRLRGEPIAVAVCRIMNDFRPLDRIVRSLWTAAEEGQRRVYLACSLAHRCHGAGVRFSVLQGIAGPIISVTESLGDACALPLVPSVEDGSFLVPRSTVVAERVLLLVASEYHDVMMEAFTSLATSIAPRVNRKAIIRRTPEARLARRLLDGDKIVRPLLGADAEGFYVAVRDSWAWNSRYWEQRALLIVERDIRTALQYARHAVAIEPHPYCLTTLGKVLFKSLPSRGRQEEARASTFGEAFGVLRQAIDREKIGARVTIHPFSTLLVGTARFLEGGGNLTLEQDEAIRSYAAEARDRYGHDPGVAKALQRLDAAM